MGGIAIDVLPPDEADELQEGGDAILGAHIDEVNVILEGLNEELERHSKGKKAAEVRMEVLRATRREIESRQLEGDGEVATGSGFTTTTGAATNAADGDAKERVATAIGTHLENADGTLHNLEEEVARAKGVIEAAEARMKEVRVARGELISLRLKDGEEVDEHGVIIMRQEPLTVLKVVEAKVRMCARRRNDLAQFHLVSGEVTKGSGPPRIEPHDEVVGDAFSFHLPARIVMNPTHGSFGIQGVQMQAGLAMEDDGAAGAAARSETRRPVRVLAGPAAAVAAPASPATARGAALVASPAASSELLGTNNAMLTGGENTL